ncbi:MAG: undecaprenyl-diphosphate phosphatase, partial [Candidatus Pacebacteria bacterium]|nr:undecaprenyl-diphosphate phosphatase [Candidatus Paceibacterota bacterium]
QGLAEFLPVSSSGHLVLISKFFNWQDQGLAFDVALHLGTLVAVLIYFRKDWRDIIFNSYLFRWFHSPDKAVEPLVQNVAKVKPSQQKRHINVQELKSDMLFIIIIATIPGVCAGLVLNDYAETVFRNSLLVAITLSIGALFLFYADRIGLKKKDIPELTLKMGIIIGLFQALAIIPGVSRSGITITIALLLGFSRTSSARFSFLLSTPIIFGAGIMEFPNLFASGLDINILIGILTATVSGYLAIKYMLKYLENKSYNIFVGYRIVLAILIITLLT